MSKTEQTIFQVLLAGAYFFAAKFGLLLAMVHPSSTPVWPPTGLALAAMLIFGYRIWPAVFIGAFFANLTTEGNIISSTIIAVGNTLEAIVGCYLVMRFAGGVAVFSNVRNILKFVLLAGLVSTMISATIGVTTLALLGFASFTDYQSIWTTWWLGNITGGIMFAPLILLWYGSGRISWSRSEFLERLLFAAIMFAVGYLIFGNHKLFDATHFSLGFLIIPVLMWGAFRFQQREVAVAALLLSAWGLFWTLKGYGPFSDATPNQSLLLLQVFWGTIMSTSLAVSSVVMQQKQISSNLYSRTVEAESLNVALRLVQSGMERIMDNLSQEKTTLTNAHTGEQAMLASIGEGLVVIDQEGNVIFANQAFLKAFGLNLSEILGKQFHEKVEMYDNEKLLPRHKHPFFESIRTGEKIKDSFFLQTPYRTIHTQITTSPVIVDGKPSGAIAIIHLE